MGSGVLHILEEGHDTLHGYPQDFFFLASKRGDAPRFQLNIFFFPAMFRIFQALSTECNVCNNCLSVDVGRWSKNPSIPQTKINKYRCEMVRFVAIQMGCRSFSREKTSIFGWISQPARFDFREGIPWRHRPISCSCSCMAGPTTATPTKQSHYDVAACMRTPIMRPIEIRRSPQRKQIRQRTEF